MLQSRTAALALAALLLVFAAWWAVGPALAEEPDPDPDPELQAGDVEDEEEQEEEEETRTIGEDMDHGTTVTLSERTTRSRRPAISMTIGRKT